jgi:cytochrome c551/c552
MKILSVALIACTSLAFGPAARPADPTIPADVQALLDKHGCAACHNMSRKLVGPIWPDIAAKKYSAKRITQLVAKPEPANWPGYVPMAAQSVPKADMKKIADWLANLK